MATVTQDLIENEFDKIDCPLDEDDDKDVIEKCISLCETYKLDASALALKWDAFRYAHDNLELTMDALKTFENQMKIKIAKEKRRAVRRQQKAKRSLVRSSIITSPIYTKHNIRSLTGKSELKASSSKMEIAAEQGSLKMEDVNSLNTGEDGTPLATPAGASRKRKGEDFVSPQPSTRHRSATYTPSPSSSSSTSVISPSIRSSPATGKYGSRTNSGEVMLTFNAEVERAPIPSGTDMEMMIQDDDITRRRVAVEVLNDVSGNAEGPFRYMYENLEEKADIIDSNMTDMMYDYEIAQAKTVKEEKKEESSKAEDLAPADDDDSANTQFRFHALNIPSQASVSFGGRVICKSVGKVKAEQLLLEGNRDVSAGRSVKMRLGLQNLKFSLFPGQVVVGQGVNANGTAMVVENFSKIPYLPHLNVNQRDVKMYNESLKNRALTMTMAAGPFTCSTDTAYSPLYDLLKRVNETKPDVLLLMGPFLDANHHDIKTQNLTDSKGRTCLYSDKFLDLIGSISHQTRFLPNLRILIVPSLDDVHHEFTFPQPPFMVDQHDFSDTRMTFLPNPSMIRLNDMMVAISTNDILRALSSNELSRSSVGSTPVPRFTRLASHIVEQRNLYPLLSPNNDNSMLDYTHFEAMRLTHTPDLLILPSQLKHFVQKLDSDTVCINPERLAKGETGGYFAELTIHPLTKEQQEEAENTSTSAYVNKHFATERTRVEIIRI